MIACYLRISTSSQNIDGQKLEVQTWLDGHNISDVRWFIDEATGNNLNRVEFQNLQSAIFNGEITTVVVARLDRLSRSIRDGINTLSGWCDAGLRVVSVSQEIDFSGSTGRMLAAVLLGVSEMETAIRKERQAAGITSAKARGVYKGRKRGTLKSNPARVLELHQQGLKDHEVAKAMGVSRSTVRRYLKKAA